MLRKSRSRERIKSIYEFGNLNEPLKNIQNKEEEKADVFNHIRLLQKAFYTLKDSKGES